MALDFVATLQPSRLIYDVMDQLAAFKGAPQGLIEREKTLLKQADIVFTGGPSLYQAKKEYGELPSYLAYFDVALILFAINEATEFLSPTKTLEYLAAQKPVVSTPIRDVIELYREVVKIGHNPAEFRQQVNLALSEDSAALLDKKAELLKRYDWDNIACQMQEIILSRLTLQTQTNKS
jgi:glycosyltransferase involved in cell wall biosynthesis